jgi:sortase B
MEKKFAGGGVRAVRIADSVVNTAVLIIVMLALAVGAYSRWDSGQMTNAASAERYESYKPTGADMGRSLPFGELGEANPEVFAWLTVYGTGIDYPVAQAEDDMKYTSTDVWGRYSPSGGIFLDAWSNKDFSDFSSIIYGHHLENHVMFGDVSEFRDRGYFDARKYGALYYDGRWRGLQFFAFLRASAYNGHVYRVDIEDPGDRQIYLDMLIDMADYARDIGVTADDHIVLLSTCSPTETNGRDILVGKITDEVYSDPFQIR